MTAGADGRMERAGAPPGFRFPGRGPLAVEIEGMSIWYGRTPAVRNLSMQVPRSSIYGLTGPRGAGKTTTMRAVATLQPPDAGRVLVDGIDVQEEPAAVRERIGYLPDFSGVYDSLTVGEYLDFYGSIYGLPPSRRRQVTGELLELVNLTEQQSRPVKALSRGMKQQLSLARCLVHDPEVLLLDEPAAGLDPESRLELREILRELSKLGKTTIISSNLLEELAESCTHLGIMREGALLAEGSVDEMIEGVAPGAELRVRLLDAAGLDTARGVLETHRACRQIDVEVPSTLRVDLEGTENDLAAILEELVRAGARVVDFTVERKTLDEVFLRAMSHEP